MAGLGFVGGAGARGMLVGALDDAPAWAWLSALPEAAVGVARPARPAPGGGLEGHPPCDLYLRGRG